MKSENSERFLERRWDRPRQELLVLRRPRAWSTASAVSWTKWSLKVPDELLEIGGGGLVKEGGLTDESAVDAQVQELKNLFGVVRSFD